jgi:hypothetical protein
MTIFVERYSQQYKSQLVKCLKKAIQAGNISQLRRILSRKTKGEGLTQILSYNNCYYYVPTSPLEYFTIYKNDQDFIDIIHLLLKKNNQQMFDIFYQKLREMRFMFQSETNSAFKFNRLNVEESLSLLRKHAQHLIDNKKCKTSISRGEKLFKLTQALTVQLNNYRPPGNTSKSLLTSIIFKNEFKHTLWANKEDFKVHRTPFWLRSLTALVVGLLGASILFGGLIGLMLLSASPVSAATTYAITYSLLLPWFISSVICLASTLKLLVDTTKSIKLMKSVDFSLYSTVNTIDRLPEDNSNTRLRADLADVKEEKTELLPKYEDVMKM